MNLAEKYLDKGYLVSPRAYDSLKKNEIKEEDLSCNGLVLVKPKKTEIKILKNFKDKPEKLKVEDIIDLYNKRLNTLKQILEKRMDNLVSIDKSKPGGEVNLIGMVRYEDEMYLEDMTGKIKINTKEDFMGDEVIGVKGKILNKELHPEKIYYPDIEFKRKIATTKKEIKSLFISDLEYGDLNKLKRLIKNKAVSYVFIAGNISKKSYRAFNKFLKNTSIDVIIIPGESDSGDEIPQSPLNLDCISLSNPAMVSLKGIKIFLYHGQNLNNNMKEILKLIRKRHLAPNKLYPYDPLLLDETPDIIHLGHVGPGHLNYKGTTLLCSSGKAYILNMKTREIEEADY